MELLVHTTSNRRTIKCLHEMRKVLLNTLNGLDSTGSSCAYGSCKISLIVVVTELEPLWPTYHLKSTLKIRNSLEQQQTGT